MKKEVFSIAININGQEVMFDADNNQVFCTSIDIAKVFGKRHDNILNLIGDKLKNTEIENFNLLNFKEIKNRHKPKNKKRKKYKQYKQSNKSQVKGGSL